MSLLIFSFVGDMLLISMVLPNWSMMLPKFVCDVTKFVHDVIDVFDATTISQKLSFYMAVNHHFLGRMFPF